MIFIVNIVLKILPNKHTSTYLFKDDKNQGPLDYIFSWKNAAWKSNNLSGKNPKSQHQLDKMNISIEY